MKLGLRGLGTNGNTGVYSIAVLVNIRKRLDEARKALGTALGTGPGEANSSNLSNLVCPALNYAQLDAAA